MRFFHSRENWKNSLSLSLVNENVIGINIFHRVRFRTRLLSRGSNFLVRGGRDALLKINEAGWLARKGGNALLRVRL